MKNRYCKEYTTLDMLWENYENLFSPDEEMNLSRDDNMELYNVELTLAMFGSAAHVVRRRRMELEILKQELEDIESSQRYAMRFLPSNEEVLGFYRPFLAESATLFG